MKHPSIGYVFFEFEQSSEEAWKVIIEFKTFWNQESNSKIEQEEEGELGILFKKGIDDPEMALLDRYLAQLKESHNINWFCGLDDTRGAIEFEQADFISIVGDSYPLEFVKNADVAISDFAPCGSCGKGSMYSYDIVDTLVIDESFLDKQIDSSPDYTPPGLDLINLVNGAMIVSSKVLSVLNENKVKGFNVIPVQSHSTGKVSERLHLLRPNKIFLQPCNEHTPTNGKGICPECGKVLGGIMALYHIRKEWLDGDELFSKDRFGYAMTYVSNRVYHLLKANKIKGLLPAQGAYICAHS